jgi:uncharacterized protein involved in tolerance to divalent cations
MFIFNLRVINKLLNIATTVVGRTEPTQNLLIFKSTEPCSRLLHLIDSIFVWQQTQKSEREIEIIKNTELAYRHS